MITSFQGEYRFLSNFHPIQIRYEGMIYPSVEHAYQASKTKDMWARRDLVGLTAGQAKRAGRHLDTWYGWEWKKLRIMELLVRRKFKDPFLKALLANTGHQRILEGNTWGDKYWGCVYESGRWVGENHLGKILMNIRSEYLNSK